MSNRFGIALDQALLRWAAAEGVTETVIAAVSLLHERSVEEIAGKLTPAELADVTRLVSRCPSCYPPGAYDALKARRNVAAEQSATRTTARVGANRPPRGHKRTSVELGPHTERAGLAERIIKIVAQALDDAWDEIEKSGSEFARPAYANATREEIAKHNARSGRARGKRPTHTRRRRGEISC